MPKRSDALLVADIIESIGLVLTYTNGLSYENFIGDRKTLDAVVRNFEIIGEASGMLSEEFKIQNPLIEVREMKAFRNRLIHEYFGIDYEIVWQIIQEELPYNYELLKKA